jgi:hypothetical protein
MMKPVENPSQALAVRRDYGVVDEPCRHPVRGGRAGVMEHERVPGQRLTAPGVAFAASPPAAADVELTLSGHGPEEFWYQGADHLPRSFDVVVDGTAVATATTLPYTYAQLGFGNANANTACSGPGNSVVGDTLHPVMWWAAQRALHLAGVHLGVGEIPPYRASIDAALLPLLAGTRTVEVVQHGGAATWVTSLTVLLNDDASQ